MKKNTLTAALLLLPAACVVPRPAQPAAIIWATHKGAGARTGTWTWSRPLPGICVPGGPVDFSNGALIQLWKAVGDIDDPRLCPGLPLLDPNCSVDDVLLDQVHVGYGWGPAGAAAEGQWSRVTNVDIITADTIYVRGYDAPLGQPLNAVGTRNTNGVILSAEVERVDIPVTYYFDDLFIQIPEPTALAFLVPGFAIWLARRRRKGRSTAVIPTVQRMPRPRPEFHHARTK